MSGWSFVALKNIFEIARGGSPRPIDHFITDDPDGINWVMIADASGSSKYITKTKKRIKPSGASRSRCVNPGDFLLTNSMSFGRPYIMKTSGCIHDGWLVLSPQREDVDQDYFYHLLGSNVIYAEFERRAAGATVKNLNIELVKNVEVPFPPIAEQKRIAAILDKAEELRSLRRKSIEQLEAIVQSIFLEMFGDLTVNPKGWKTLLFQDIFVAPLRNGLSPSHSGKVIGKVLTLSAITGDQFNDGAIKTSTFQSDPPPHQTVADNDFLICRGNGNLHLVGKGYFPTRSMPDVVFPDTMIAARVDSRSISRVFLQYIWNSKLIRSQIESLARTTNGTLKVNQTMLEGISLLTPPLSLQQEFAQRVEAIEQLKTTHRESLAQLDALFASLQHRAFRGEL